MQVANGGSQYNINEFSIMLASDSYRLTVQEPVLIPVVCPTTGAITAVTVVNGGKFVKADNVWPVSVSRCVCG